MFKLRNDLKESRTFIYDFENFKTEEETLS